MATGIKKAYSSKSHQYLESNVVKRYVQRRDELEKLLDGVGVAD